MSRANEEQRAKITKALTPPVTEAGTPGWYGSDDDAWAEFERSMRQ